MCVRARSYRWALHHTHMHGHEHTHMYTHTYTQKQVPASDPDARIDFQFVDAGFDLSLLPFRIPYPVPFRLLGDEVKGWIEVRA